MTPTASSGGDGGAPITGTPPDGVGAPAPPPGARAAGIVRWFLVLGMVAVAVASYLYVRRGAGARTGSVAAVTATGAARHVRYQCPMHPQIVRDQPGECPICNMTLVPIEVASPPSSPGTPVPAAPAALAPITLSPERLQLAGVKTAPVARRSLDTAIRVPGVVATTERGLVDINTRFAGWIESVHVAETGRRVAKGQALATIFSPELLAAQQELLTARRWSSSPGTSVPHAAAGAAPAAGAAHGGAPGAGDPLGAGLADDARKRLELLGMATDEIAEVMRTGHPLHAVTVRAPAAGTVIRRGAVAGAYVQPGSELYAIADLSTLWFVAEVPEPELARVRAGQAARVELTALPGATFNGRVLSLAPTLSADTRTLRVRVELGNPRGNLRPGMYGQATFASPAGADMALVVPADAVVDSGDTQYVFVALGEGRFEPRRVAVGARAGAWIAVQGGVREGEQVVTTAGFLIDSESRLRAAVEGAR